MTPAKRYIVWGGLGLAVLAALMGKLSMALNQSLNSDHGFLGLVYYDVVNNNNYLLRHWYVPTNTCLFTDVPFIFLAGLFFGLSPMSVKAMAFLQLALGAVLAAMVGAKAFNRGTGALFAFFLLSSTVEGSRHLLSFWHVMTVNYSLLGLILLFGLARSGPMLTGKTVALLLSLFVLSMLVMFSDPYYTASFIAPASLAMGLLALRCRPSSGLLVPALAVSSIVGGGLSGLLFQKTAGYWGFNVTMLHGLFAVPSELPIWAGGTLEHFLKIFDLEFRTPSGALTALTMASLAPAVVYVLVKESDPLRRLGLCYFAGLGGLLALVLLFKKGLEARYFLPFVYVYAFMLAAVIGNERVPRLARALLLVLALLASAHNIYGSFRFRQPQTHAGLVGFLRGEGLVYGYSNNWNSNIISFLSGDEIRVRPLKFWPEKGAFTPWHFLSKSTWFHPSRYEGPSFLLVSRQDPSWGFGSLTDDVVLKTFGRPEKALAFEGYRIYVWPYNILKAIMSVPIKADTPRETGEFVQEGGVAFLRADRGQAGMLVHGNFWGLLGADYRAVYDLQAEGAPGAEAAKIMVNRVDLRTGVRTTVSDESVFPTRPPAWEKQEIHFMVDEAEGTETRYEFAAYATGLGRVALRSLYVEKF